MYKVNLIILIYKIELFIKKIFNRTKWILDCSLELKKYKYENWFKIQRLENVIRVLKDRLKNESDPELRLFIFKEINRFTDQIEFYSNPDVYCEACYLIECECDMENYLNKGV